MRIIVLLEGLDKTGKSTEAERLARLPDLGPVVVHHFGVPTENPFEEYVTALQRAEAFDGSTIIDRLHWSDEAYGQVYRQGSPNLLNPKQLEALDFLMYMIGGAVVLKTRPVIEIVQAMDKDDYGVANLDKVRLLKQIFLRRYAETPCVKMIVPFGNQLSFQQIQSVARLTVTAAERRKARVIQ